MKSTYITTPALVITLGTTSSLAALELQRHMLALEENDRRAVSFLHIDTDDPPPQLREFRARHPGAYQEAVARIAVPKGISSGDTLPAAIKWHTFIPAKLPQHYDNGAGGVRNNGHVAFAYQHAHIQQRLEESLASLERLGAEQDALPVKAMQVYIVAYVGCGTGSGILADITVMARDLIRNRQYDQRTLIYGILPGDHIKGAILNEKNRRKSNAVAAMLEVLAHGLAGAGAGTLGADGRLYPTGEYSKFLLSTEFRVPKGPIANEILLLGRTNMESVEDTARIVGLDLFQRITDASGVGDKDRSMTPDRGVLGEFDDQELPTIFGTSCPFETRWPALEAAEAFAQVTASHLLSMPEFIGRMPTEPRMDDAEQSAWRKKWREVATPGQKSTGNQWLITPPRFFHPEDIEPIYSRDALNVKWGQAERSMSQTVSELDRVMGVLLEFEEARLREVPSRKRGDPPSPFARRVVHLFRLRAEYRQAFDETPEKPKPEPRPSQLEDKVTNPAFPVVVPGVDAALHTRYARALAQKYSDIMRAHYQYERALRLRVLLSTLLARVEGQLKDAEQWFSGANVASKVQQLRDEGYGHPAWQGELERIHPHQRHLFDLTSLQEYRKNQALDVRGASAHSPAMEGVYRWATVRGNNLALGKCDRGVTLDTEDFPAFHETLLTRLIPACSEYINTGRREEQDELASRAAAPGEQGREPDLESERGDEIASKVVEFLRGYYLEWFADKNLFDFLEIGVAATRNILPAATRELLVEYLREHLAHIKRQLRDLVTYEPELWHNGSHNLLTALFVGMDRRVEHGEEKILERALSDVEPMTDRAETALLTTKMYDRHRLQVLYSQHGISLRTLPDFYRPRNSAMEQYQLAQRHWAGDWRGALRGGTYGRGAMPPHASGEMERLVWQASALPNRAQLALPDRIIRQDVTTEDEPPYDIEGHGYLTAQGGPPPANGPYPPAPGAQYGHGAGGYPPSPGGAAYQERPASRYNNPPPPAGRRRPADPQL